MAAARPVRPAPAEGPWYPECMPILAPDQRLRAVDALTSLLDSKTPAVKLAAAKTVLELTSKSAPATALDTRFTAIMTLLQGAPTP